MERFADPRRMVIRTVMVTGDNVITATATAIDSEAGATKATPHDRLKNVRDEQRQGR